MTTVPETAGRKLPFGLSGDFQIQEYALLGVVILLVIAGAILEPDVFPTSDNILNVLRQSSVIGVLAIGMTFVIATAGIDLSVGSMVAPPPSSAGSSPIPAAWRSCSGRSAWASCSAGSTPA